MNKNIEIIRHFLKYRDFVGNIGTFEGLIPVNEIPVNERKMQGYKIY